ncbi:MAG: UDP-glucose dehydrogenase family protein [Candidatus Puniceispirillales bacterium]
MKIAVIGTGYVGIVSGVCFAEFGFNVTCVDKDENKIKGLKKGKVPIYEPGLETILQRNVKANRLSFTSNLSEAVKKSDVVFIAVGTPSRRGDGYADLTFVFSATEEIAQSINGYTVVVTKSTVPVGTVKRVKEIIKKNNPNAKFDVVSNPEFLREGSAIEDFMRPDRVVVGLESERAKRLMSALYRPLFLLETPIIFTSLESSELIKYASNAFLAVKISYINQMSDLCENVGANIDDVARGMGLDKRIGNKFLHTGPGYGGSCFPKDTIALVKTAKDNNTTVSLVEETVRYNSLRKNEMVYKIQQVSGKIENKNIAILGLSFKPETDDMRESPAIDIVNGLLKLKAKINVYDPAAMPEAKEIFSNKIHFSSNAQECIKNKDILVILTEWNEFRALDPKLILKLMRGNIIIDLRNIFDPNEMLDENINYVSLGRN